MTAVTPDQDAIRAAASFDAMPPLPRSVPAPDVETASKGSSAATTGITVASGFVRGSAVYKPAVSVRSTNMSALTKCESNDARWSLSP
ncbi:unannotated protein [freshwater metagenome]|uniref:Unannotated protein n=1 Tax=freshwater metagenome TaxID=449393 RepID=A0A6J6JSD8_9ZZZZ